MAKPFLAIHVDCYAGYRGEEEPRRFLVDDHEIDVIGVVDRWRTPTHRYFKVNGSDGAQYTLRHHEASRHWELEKTSAP